MTSDQLPMPPPGRELLAGKVAVITAAAGAGIGSATAKRCLAEGAHVAISDQHVGRLEAFATELEAEYGNRIWAMPCDVTDSSAVDALIHGAADHFGHIDVMMTDADWSRVLDVTLNGTFRCTRAALRQMIAQGQGGVVVNNASVLGWRAQEGQA